MRLFLLDSIVISLKWPTVGHRPAFINTILPCIAIRTSCNKFFITFSRNFPFLDVHHDDAHFTEMSLESNLNAIVMFLSFLKFWLFWKLVALLFHHYYLLSYYISDVISCFFCTITYNVVVIPYIICGLSVLIVPPVMSFLWLYQCFLMLKRRPCVRQNKLFHR